MTEINGWPSEVFKSDRLVWKWLTDVELIRWMNSDGSNPQDQDISADSHFIFYIVQIVYPYTDKLLAW